MPRLPKFVRDSSVVFATTSVKEVFVFPANPLINELLLKSMAQAQALFHGHARSS